MIHDEKTTELELPGLTPKPRVQSPLSRPSDWDESDTQISLKSSAPSWTWKLLLATAVLFLSVLMLSGF